MPEPPDDSLEPIDRLRAIVRILRGPGGCPWDIEQTQKSLIPNILEEAYEAADAIRSGNKNNVIEELGDLLLQVVMQSEIASESDDFFLEDVANAISDKLIRRHPHVFGDDQLNDTESVLNKWEEIKRSVADKYHFLGKFDIAGTQIADQPVVTSRRALGSDFYLLGKQYGVPIFFDGYIKKLAGPGREIHLPAFKGQRYAVLKLERCCGRRLLAGCNQHHHHGGVDKQKT